MVKEREYSSKVTETKFNRPFAIVEKKNHEDFNNSNERQICKNAGEEVEVKVKIKIASLENIEDLHIMNVI